MKKYYSIDPYRIFSKYSELIKGKKVDGDIILDPLDNGTSMMLRVYINNKCIEMWSDLDEEEDATVYAFLDVTDADNKKDLTITQLRNLG